MYPKESFVRQAARTDRRVLSKGLKPEQVLKEAVETAGMDEKFDVFLSHSIQDSELVLGAKNLLEAKN